MTVRIEPEYTWRGAQGPSLVGLVGGAPVSLDPHGVQAAFGERPPDGATCIAGARLLPVGHVPGGPRRPGARPLHDVLADACARVPAGPVALALSGGVDSAVLAALLRPRAVAYTLVPDLPGYGEEAEARAVAEALGVPLRCVRVRERDYVEALPAAIAACECPLYNLHPVSRHLLAQAVNADGLGVLVTGDGADEVFRDASGADLLPISGALTRAAGLRPCAPFLDPAVAPEVAIDRRKLALRGLARDLGVPAAIADHPKRPRYTPPIDLSRHWDPGRVAALARGLGRAPALTSDRERVGFTTLALLSRGFPGLVLSCAA